MGQNSSISLSVIGTGVASLFAGSVGSAVGTGVAYPLDVLKTKAQTSQPSEVFAVFVKTSSQTNRVGKLKSEQGTGTGRSAFGHAEHALQQPAAGCRGGGHIEQQHGQAMRVFRRKRKQNGFEKAVQVNFFILFDENFVSLPKMAIYLAIQFKRPSLNEVIR